MAEAQSKMTNSPMNIKPAEQPKAAGRSMTHAGLSEWDIQVDEPQCSWDRDVLWVQVSSALPHPITGRHPEVVHAAVEAARKMGMSSNPTIRSGEEVKGPVNGEGKVDPYMKNPAGCRWAIRIPFMSVSM